MQVHDILLFLIPWIVLCASCITRENAVIMFSINLSEKAC